MNPVRIVIIVVALVAAVLLALVVRGMISQPKAPPVTVAAAPAAPPMARVLVASADLQIGDSLSKDNITWQDWPAATINAAYITDGAPAAAPQTGAPGVISNARKTITDIATNGGPQLQAMVGSIVKEPIFKGEPITAKKIVRSGDSSYMAVRLQPGTRAISLPITAESGAGGFIQPGDHIDILTSHPDASKNGGGMVSETVLSNIMVLAVDQRTESPKTGATSMVGATLTLEVPAGSVETLAKAKAQGNLVMALRSYADIAPGVRRAGGPGDTVLLFKGGAPAEAVTAR